VAKLVTATERAECKAIASTAVLATRESIEASDIRSATYSCIASVTGVNRSKEWRRSAAACTKSQPDGRHCGARSNRLTFVAGTRYDGMNRGMSPKTVRTKSMAASLGASPSFAMWLSQPTIITAPLVRRWVRAFSARYFFAR